MAAQGTFEYRTTRTFLLIPLALFGFFCALTAWVILGGVIAGGTKYWAIVVLGPPLFGGLLLYYLYQFVALPPLLVIDGVGVRRRRLFGETVVPWGAIARVIAHRHRKEIAIELVASPSPLPEAVLRDIFNRTGQRPRIVAPGSFLRVSTMLVNLDLEDALRRIAERVGPALQIEERTYASNKEFRDKVMDWSKAA